MRLSLEAFDRRDRPAWLAFRDVRADHRVLVCGRCVQACNDLLGSIG
jgi:hypothetical protein